MDKKFSSRKKHDFQGTVLLNNTGQFGPLLERYHKVFEKYFKDSLFSGSFNVKIPEPHDLHQNLDEKKFKPEFVIPENEFVIPGNELNKKTSRLKDGQVWRCQIKSSKSQEPIQPCWIFRRIESRVPCGVIEIVSPIHLVETYGFQHGDPVQITLFEGPAQETP